MWACSLTSKWVVPINSSKPTSGHSLTGAPSTRATGDQPLPRRSTGDRQDRDARSLDRRLARSPERPPPGQAVAGEVATADAEALALPPEELSQPRLGAWVVDPEHALDDAGDELRVEVLHAVRQHQLGRPAQLAVIAQHEGTRETPLVAGQPDAGGV